MTFNVWKSSGETTIANLLAVASIWWQYFWALCKPFKEELPRGSIGSAAATQAITSAENGHLIRARAITLGCVARFLHALRGEISKLCGVFSA